MDLRFGAGRRQVGSERSESMPRLGLLNFKCGEKSLLLRNGIA
jgi:hypothetical protein